MKHKTLSSSKTISRPRDKILVIRCYLVIKSYNLVIKAKKVKFIKEAIACVVSHVALFFILYSLMIFFLCAGAAAAAGAADQYLPV